jgi:hypothetical protein
MLLIAIYKNGQINAILRIAIYKKTAKIAKSSNAEFNNYKLSEFRSVFSSILQFTAHARYRQPASKLPLRGEACLQQTSPTKALVTGIMAALHSYRAPPL